MMPNNETYTKCYDLISTKSITKKEFIELCILLSNEFNNYYNTNEYVFTPEAISEVVYYLKTLMMEINIKQ